MLGKIVKVNSKGLVNLMVVVDFKNTVENPFDYYFKFIPYSKNEDDLMVNLSMDSMDFMCGTANLGNFVEVQEEKLHYTKCGESDIRGVKHIYLERKWDEIKIPTR